MDPARRRLVIAWLTMGWLGGTARAEAVPDLSAVSPGAKRMRLTRLFAYAMLGLPLAMAMLPIYMISPKFYGDTLGVSLSALGFVLFATRILDTAQDPWIGRLVDALQSKRHGWSMLVCFATVTLSCGFVMLFSPPDLAQTGLLVWLSVSLIIVYTSHSLINICYLTWGTRLSDNTNDRTRVAGWRETAGLVGVLLASILPSIWVSRLDARVGYQVFSWVFVALLVVGSIFTLTGAERPSKGATQVFDGWKLALAPSAIRQVLCFYLCNAISVAIPATLVLFYIDDVLVLQEWTALFLGLYFFFGLVGLPGWVWLAARFGKPRTWLFGSLVSILSLSSVFFLDSGSLLGYALVCVCAGAALGADLVLPIAMLADAIPATHRHTTGFYLGLWALIGKLALAFAAGMSLPLLQATGYVPGFPATARGVAVIYAFLPAVFKVLAIWIMHPDILPEHRKQKELINET